jgi:hypothetical protein
MYFSNKNIGMKMKRRKGDSSELLSGLISIPAFLSTLNTSLSQYKNLIYKNIYIKLRDVCFQIFYLFVFVILIGFSFFFCSSLQGFDQSRFFLLIDQMSLKFIHYNIVTER